MIPPKTGKPNDRNSIIPFLWTSLLASTIMSGNNQVMTADVKRDTPKIVNVISL